MSIIQDENIAIYPQKYSVFADTKYKPVYSVVGFLPSNESQKRVMNLVIDVTLYEKIDNKRFLEVVYDFAEVDQQGFDVTIENEVSGHLRVGNKDVDPRTHMRYKYDDKNKILRLTIRNPYNEQRSFKRVYKLFYNIFINDYDAFGDCICDQCDSLVGITRCTNCPEGMSVCCCIGGTYAYACGYCSA